MLLAAELTLQINLILSIVLSYSIFTSLFFFSEVLMSNDDFLRQKSDWYVVTE